MRSKEGGLLGLIIYYWVQNGWQTKGWTDSCEDSPISVVPDLSRQGWSRKLAVGSPVVLTSSPLESTLELSQKRCPSGAGHICYDTDTGFGVSPDAFYLPKGKRKKETLEAVSC